MCCCCHDPLLLVFLCTGWRCDREHSQPDYKSWIPDHGGLAQFCNKTDPEKAIVGRLFVAVARAFNWSVCYDAHGFPLFYYYTDYSWARDFDAGLLWPEVSRVMYATMKEVFRACARALLGT